MKLTSSSLVRRCLAALAVLALSPTGCIVYVRDSEHLAEESAELVEGRADVLKACYDEFLVHEQRRIEEHERRAQGPYEDIGPAVSSAIKSAKGTVVVQFEVEPKTGKLLSPRVVDELSDAPDALNACVLGSLADLAIEPPDTRRGFVTFAWRFRVGKRRPDRPQSMDAPQNRLEQPSEAQSEAAPAPASGPAN